ncbi:hypothetical protein [Nocardia sp. NPDC006630]|uniref:hypothetical protein n=1 Tax=Nocardia sp. NPDC006630 TaxID=3157181 RepID=UPI0033B38856
MSANTEPNHHEPKQPAPQPNTVSIAETSRVHGRVSPMNRQQIKGRLERMDPVTMIAAAIAAGAAAGLTDTTKKAVTDAYQAVKTLITHRYQTVDVSVLEAHPIAPAQRTLLAQELTDAGATDDPELRTAAWHLLNLIQEHTPQVAEAVGVQLRRVETGELEISDITSSGSAVIAEDTKVQGTLKISGIHAGNSEPPHPHSPRR